MAEASDFPFLSEVQAAQENRPGATAEALQELSLFREYNDKWGGLIVQSMARFLLGISTPGVIDLCNRGKIRHMEIAGVKLCSLADVIARMNGERGRMGRPLGSKNKPK